MYGVIMKNGYWIPIDKRTIARLPKDRPYTDTEALLSLAVDIDNKRPWTIRGYAALWQWNRKKVKKFVHTLLSGADYTGPSQGPHRGPRKGPPIRFVFNNLPYKKDLKKDHEKDTTIDPLNPLDPINVNDKGILHAAKSYPLSFDAFLKRHNQENTEAVEAVQYFLQKYKWTFGKNHKLLRPETWQQVVNTLLYDGMDEELEYNDICVLIDKYFQIDFTDCDYSISHFNTDGIKMRRFYEELY